MVENQQWSAPSLEQVAELAAGILPREFESADEIPGRTGKMLPTPTASDGQGGGRSPEAWERAKRESGGGCSNLRDSMKSLLPTPLSRDWKGKDGRDYGQRDGGASLPGAIDKLLPTPTSSGGGKGGSDFAREEREGSGGDDLGTTVVKMALLPTPNASLANYSEEPEAWEQRSKHKAEPRETVGDLSLPLPVAVKRKMLPTPTSSDGIGSRRETARTEEWTSNAGTTLTDAAMKSTGASTEPQSEGGKSSSGGLRLSPWFVEWMMGAPHDWTDPDCQLSATEFSCRRDG